MLGRLVGDSASSPWGVSDAEVSNSEQLVTKRRKTAIHPTSIARSALLVALKDLSPLLTIRNLLPFLAGFFDAERLGTRCASLTTSQSACAGDSAIGLSTKLQRKVLLGVLSRREIS